MKAKSLIFFSATSNRLILPLAAALAVTGGAHAATLEWDSDTVTSGAQGGTGTWNNTAPNVWWNGSSNTAWTDSSANDAVFGGTAGSVTLGGNRTAGSVQFNTAGYTLFFGTSTARQLALTSLGGSALSNTTFIASSTLTTGTNNIIFNHGANDFTFAGIVADNGLGNKTGLYLQSSGRFILGAGTNYTATGQLTMASTGPLRLATTSGLPSNYEHAAASNSTVELAAGDFSKVFVTAFVGTNDFRTRGGNLGFAAIGGDRTVTMANSTDVTWGTSNNLNVGVLTLGTADSTGKLTLTHADSSKFLRLQNSTAGTVTREIRTDNGSAAIDAEIAVKLADGATAGRLGAINKTGDGVLALTAANTYTGGTTVTAGKLLINGSTSTGLVTVGASGTLGGTGTVGGATTVNGTLSPGQSPGTLTFQNTLALVGLTLMEIDGTSGAGVTGGHDFVNLTGAGAAGALTYGGTMTLDIGAIFGVGSYSWNLFDFVSETGGFTSISLADQYLGSLTDAGGGVWGLTSGVNTWSFTESTGVLGLAVAVVPEPRAALLGGLGMLMLLRRRRN